MLVIQSQLPGRSLYLNDLFCLTSSIHPFVLITVLNRNSFPLFLHRHDIKDKAEAKTIEK